MARKLPGYQERPNPFLTEPDWSAWLDLSALPPAPAGSLVEMPGLFSCGQGFAFTWAYDLDDGEES